jgi:transcriptional regulator with XRE-family HTH domain
VHIQSSRKCAFGDVASLMPFAHTVSMSRKAPKTRHFIRQWRKHRGLTLEQLAERIGMSHQNLGKIERGKVPYNQTLLEALSEELNCELLDLVIRDPASTEPIMSIWATLDAVQKRQILEIIQTLQRPGHVA